MAVSIAVSDVVSTVASRLHLPTPASGEFLTDTIMLDYAKSAVERLSGLLTRLYGDTFFTTTATLATVAGTAAVALPASFATLESLHFVLNGKAYPLKPSDVADYDPTSAAWTLGAMPTYRIEGDTIVLHPTPNAVYSLRAKYTTGLFITATSDTIQGQVGWKEWLVLDICEQIRDREEKDASKFVAKKAVIEQQLMEQASQRDRYAPHQVRDARGELSRTGRFARGRLPWHEV